MADIDANTRASIENPYLDLQHGLAAAICTDKHEPCEECEKAALRIVVHRRVIRQRLVAFAEAHARPTS